jgi:hypothetical protein
VGTDTSDQLFNGLVVGGGNAGVGENLGAQLGFGDTEQELLLFGALGSWEVGNKEVL